MTYARDPQVLENFKPADTLPAWKQREREYRMKKDCHSSKFLRAKKEADEITQL